MKDGSNTNLKKKFDDVYESEVFGDIRTFLALKWMNSH
jgi:hypothetical protein